MGNAFFDCTKEWGKNDNNKGSAWPTLGEFESIDFFFLVFFTWMHTHMRIRAIQHVIDFMRFLFQIHPCFISCSSEISWVQPMHAEIVCEIILVIIRRQHTQIGEPVLLNWWMCVVGPRHSSLLQSNRDIFNFDRIKCDDANELPSRKGVAAAPHTHIVTSTVQISN